MFWEKYYKEPVNFSLHKRIKEGNKEIIELSGEGDIVPLELYQSSTPIYPPFLFLHGMGTKEKRKKMLIKSFLPLVEKGHPMIFYPLPGHFKKKKYKDMKDMKDKDFMEFFSRSVREIRGIINFFNKEKIQVIGISMGGMIGIIAMAVEEKIRKGVFIGAGGNFESILWRGILRLILKKDCTRRKCHMFHERYKEALAKRDFERLLSLPRYCFLYDPLTFSHLLEGRKVLLINGFLDFVIPIYSAYELKKKIKNSQWLIYPATHLSISLFFPFIRRRIEKFLEE